MIEETMLAPGQVLHRAMLSMGQGDHTRLSRGDWMLLGARLGVLAEHDAAMTAARVLARLYRSHGAQSVPAAAWTAMRDRSPMARYWRWRGAVSQTVVDLEEVERQAIGLGLAIAQHRVRFRVVQLVFPLFLDDAPRGRRDRYLRRLDGIYTYHEARGR